MQKQNEITSEHVFLSAVPGTVRLRDLPNLNDIPVPNFLFNNIPENWIEFTPYWIQIKSLFLIHKLAWINLHSWVQRININPSLPVDLLVQKVDFIPIFSLSFSSSLLILKFYFLCFEEVLGFMTMPGICVFHCIFIILYLHAVF